MSDAIAQTDGLRHGYAQVGDVRLHYAERGEGERLVLLLHGFPECWHSWRHQLAALGDAGGFRVVAPDLRGYNLSDKPAGIANYRMSLLVEDVIGLIRHFGAREAAIAGHDWGAAIAWEAARLYPGFVLKLAALQVPPLAAWRRNITLKQLLMSWYMLFFQLPCVPERWIRREDFRELAAMFRRTARRGTFTDEDIEIYKNALKREGVRSDETNALTAAINYYRANFLSLWLQPDGVNAEQKRIRVPTLFIYGERDFAVAPETVRGVKDFIDAPYRELRLPFCNHWVQQESPHEVNNALVQFLSE